MLEIANEAKIHNPRLDAFTPFIGVWNTVGHHSMIAGTTLHGRISFEWHEGGGFVCVRSDVVEGGIPSAIAIIGSDDATSQFTMSYFDERGVSRRFDVVLEGSELRWWRTAPGFSQRFVLTIAADGKTMRGVSSLSKDDKTWEQDMEVSYTRAE
jgi:hypothetical protein